MIAGEQPQIVFHAAALKHVPMVEANPVEGVLTNVIGSRNVAEAARAFGAGAGRDDLDRQGGRPGQRHGRHQAAGRKLLPGARPARGAAAALPGTRFVTVRFGNVLGSTGSVVPLFARQLAAGGPLTVTHPEVSRFFMTVREAVELVLEASATTPEAGERRGARQDFRARHGRAGQDRRPGAPDDPAGRAASRQAISRSPISACAPARNCTRRCSTRPIAGADAQPGAAPGGPAHRRLRGAGALDRRA